MKIHDLSFCVVGRGHPLIRFLFWLPIRWLAIKFIVYVFGVATLLTLITPWSAMSLWLAINFLPFGSHWGGSSAGVNCLLSHQSFIFDTAFMSVLSMFTDGFFRGVFFINHQRDRKALLY